MRSPARADGPRSPPPRRSTRRRPCGSGCARPAGPPAGSAARRASAGRGCRRSARLPRRGSPSGSRPAARRRPGRRRKLRIESMWRRLSSRTGTRPGGEQVGPARRARRRGPPSASSRRRSSRVPLGPRQRLEVADRAEVDVRRLVPAVGQRPRDGHPPSTSSCARRRQWPKFGNETIPTRPTSPRAGRAPAGGLAATSESTTTSKEPSSNSGRPRSMSASTTGTPRSTQAWRPRARPPPPALDSRATRSAPWRSPSPHPRSSTREPGEPSARRGPGPPSRAGGRGRPLPGDAVEERGHRAVVLRHHQQERVVAVR